MVHWIKREGQSKSVVGVDGTARLVQWTYKKGQRNVL